MSEVINSKSSATATRRRAAGSFGLAEYLAAYLQLTKPSIMLLVLVTGATALVLEGSFLSQPLNFVFVMVGLYLTGGSANAFNQYLERDVDARMRRTQRRRPLPQGIIKPTHALLFAAAIGITGVGLFYYFFNLLTAALSLATILFYSIVYTLYLKPNTYQNIVIGGAAGAMAPVGAWTAATGHMDILPWTIFLIVFLWTPPHFWALALFCKDDYREVGYPMLPVLKGDKATYRQMIYYSFALVISTVLPSLAGVSWIYGGSALVLGGYFLFKTFMLQKLKSDVAARSLFGYSIIYLFAICAALMGAAFI